MGGYIQSNVFSLKPLLENNRLQNPQSAGFLLLRLVGGWGGFCTHPGINLQWTRSDPNTNLGAGLLAMGRHPIAGGTSQGLDEALQIFSRVHAVICQLGCLHRTVNGPEGAVSPTKALEVSIASAFKTSFFPAN